jgi:hypothetical protein
VVSKTNKQILRHATFTSNEVTYFSTEVQTGNSSFSIGTSANEFNTSPIWFGNPLGEENVRKKETRCSGTHGINVLDNLKENGEDTLVDFFHLGNKWSQNLDERNDTRSNLANIVISLGKSWRSTHQINHVCQYLRRDLTRGL